MIGLSAVQWFSLAELSGLRTWAKRIDLQLVEDCTSKAQHLAFKV